MNAVHGYGRYTQGCRCDVCRTAKATYVRQRRADARALAREHTDPFPSSGPLLGESYRRFIVSGVKHGTSHAYYERGCRCLDCTAFKTADARARRNRRRAS